MEELSSAAMKAAKRSAGGIPELREHVAHTPPPIANKAATQTLKRTGDVTRSQNRGIRGPTKRTYALQNFFYNKCTN